MYYLILISITPILIILFHITLLITFILDPVLPAGHTLYRDMKLYGGYRHCIKCMFKDVGGWFKYTYNISDISRYITRDIIMREGNNNE